MHPILDRLRKTPGPILLAALFAIMFALGLAVFSLSGSIAVSAICMGLASVASALFARDLATAPDDGKIKSIIRDETRQFGRRLTEISDRILEIESEIRTLFSDRATPDQLRFDGMSRDIERLSTILGDLIAVVDTQAAQKPKPEAKPKSSPQDHAPLVQPPPAKPVEKPRNPLAALQTEHVLREDLLNGKLKVRLHDVLQMDTGRVFLREVKCRIDGRSSEFRSDRDLIDGKISPGIIQLFDRMRFGFAYEFASQFGTQNGSAPILCPLMNATFGHAEAADEIVDIIENNPEILRHLILALDHTLLSHASPAEDERLRRLQGSGAEMAAILTQDMMIDPDILFERGVRYAIADAAMLVGRTTHMVRSAIHPSDLASYLRRHEIALIAEGVETPADLKALQAIGVVYASGSALTANGTGFNAPRPIDRRDIAEATGTRGLIQTGTFDGQIAASATSAPLRERLRRVRT